MAAKKVKATSRKVKDKWKAKEWYKVHAPRMFNEAEIGETPSADPENLLGRTAEVTVQELTGDYSKMHIKLRFRISGIDGHDAKTTFIGHDLTSDYVRRLTRRKKTKTDHVVDVATKDGFVIRLKPMSIAERRIQASKEDAMRGLMGQSLTEMGKEMTLSEIVKAIVSGDLAKNVAKACRVIIPIKRVEIRRSEILAVGEGEPEPIIEAPAPEQEEAPAEGAAPAEDAEPAAEAPAEEPEAAEPAEEAEEAAPAEERAGSGSSRKRLPNALHMPRWLSLVERRTHRVLVVGPLPGKSEGHGFEPHPRHYHSSMAGGSSAYPNTV